MCEALGWKGKGTSFDVLPIVLSDNNGRPSFFEIPEEIVLMVDIEHPR